MDNLQNVEQAVTTITAQELAAKAQSKREIYNFLAIDARAYLPDSTLVTIYFLKELVNGTKKFVKQEDVKQEAEGEAKEEAEKEEAMKEEPKNEAKQEESRKEEPHPS